MGLTDRVNQYWNAQTFIGKKVKVVTGRSSADQEYAILVTSGLWYACRVFVADMSPHIRSRRPSDNDLIINTDCFTMNGVNEFINEMKAFFAKPNLTQLKNYLPLIPGCLDIREVPSDWGNNPDKYIKRGDIILSDFVAGSSHAGIYIGNGKVAHMSGHGQGKAAGKCRIGDLVGDFVHNKTDVLRLGLIRVQIRPREFIATEAERMASDNYRDGEYNLLLKNCQHFAMLCATGSECLTDMGGRSLLEAARIDFPR